MFYAFPGPIEIAHLTSSDGHSWTPQKPDPTLASGKVPVDGGGIDVSTGYAEPNGDWALFYTTITHSAPATIGRLTAHAPNGPWTPDPKPILTPDASGSLDAAGVGWPSVVKTATGYEMWFEGMAKPNLPGVIEMATSTDGESWTKRPQPVLRADRPWEMGAVGRPQVAAISAGYVMVYSDGKAADRGVAWSADGVTWTKGGTDPAITKAIFPVVGLPYDGAVTAQGGSLTYYLEIGGSPFGTNDYEATATLP